MASSGRPYLAMLSASQIPAVSSTSAVAGLRAGFDAVCEYAARHTEAARKAFEDALVDARKNPEHDFEYSRAFLRGVVMATPELEALASEIGGQLIVAAEATPPRDFVYGVITHNDADYQAAIEQARAEEARGHGQDTATHYAHAMIGNGAETPRCGAIGGKVALFAYVVTCPRCLAMLAEARAEEARIAAIDDTRAAAAEYGLHARELHKPSDCGDGVVLCLHCGALWPCVAIRAAEVTKDFAATPSAAPTADDPYTAEQLDGIACTSCGREFAIGESSRRSIEFNGHQLFRHEPSCPLIAPPAPPTGDPS